jgi:hypothetical protein
VLRQSICGLAAITILCWTCAVVGAETPTKKLYDLRFRPQTGLRIAYEQTMRSDLELHGATAARTKADTTQKLHRQVVVTSEEITAIRNREPVAKRVTYGANCWSATKEGNQPTKKVALVQANKTVNYTIAADGSAQQDVGVKPTRQEAEVIRNSMTRGAALLPNKMVEVGERWRGDEGLRQLLNLHRSDTVSGILTLKAVRQQQGREVADIAISAGAITKQGGLNAEMSIEGIVSVDVQTGITIGSHLTATSTIAANMGRGSNITGTGKLELHQNGRFVVEQTTADADK